MGCGPTETKVYIIKDMVFVREYDYGDYRLLNTEFVYGYQREDRRARHCFTLDRNLEEFP